MTIVTHALPAAASAIILMLARRLKSLLGKGLYNLLVHSCKTADDEPTDASW